MMVVVVRLMAFAMSISLLRIMGAAPAVIERVAAVVVEAGALPEEVALLRVIVVPLKLPRLVAVVVVGQRLLVKEAFRLRQGMLGIIFYMRLRCSGSGPG